MCKFSVVIAGKFSAKKFPRGCIRVMSVAILAQAAALSSRGILWSVHLTTNFTVSLVLPFAMQKIASAVLLPILALHAVGSVARRMEDSEETEQLQAEISSHAMNETAMTELLEEFERPRLAQDFVRDIFFEIFGDGLHRRNAYGSGLMKLFDGYSKGLCEPEEAFGDGKDDSDAEPHCKEPISHPIEGSDRQYVSYSKVVDLLTKVPEKHSDGTLTRGNELGLFRLGNDLWEQERYPELQKIGLGASARTHQKLRPVFDHLLTEKMWAVSDLSVSLDKLMERKWLKAGGDAVFRASDVAAWAIDELHKIQFGFEFTDDKFKVEDFLTFQKHALAISVFSGLGQEFTGIAKHLLPGVELISWLLIPLFGSSDVASKREQWAQHYAANLDGEPKKVIEASMHDGPQASKAFILKGLLESLFFAGGLSVPSVIKNGLAVLHSKNSPMEEAARKALLSGEAKEDGLDQFRIEVIRMYPAVVGFPSTSR